MGEEIAKRRDVTSLDKSIQAHQGKGSSTLGESNDKGTSMARLNSKDTSPYPIDLVASQMLHEYLHQLIKMISPKGQDVIQLQLGIDDCQPQSLDNIGKKFLVEKE
eukprot:13252669-Ditylum_brightwellii.AAC.1